ncbi:MAG: OmpA family protein [Ferruginibacter sp.]
MKRILLGVIALAFISINAEAQKAKKVSEKKKGELFGIGFSISDFNAPKNFGGNSNATTLNIKDMSAGLSLSYWRGITSKIDFAAKLNAIFHDYSALYNGTPGKTEIGLELEPTINIRPIKDENMWSPYLSVGAGLGLYTNRVGAYIPIGGGLQLNANNTTYFFLQATYKASITPNVVKDNMHYSLGFAENISREKPEVKAALPIIPVVVDKDKDGVPDESDLCPDVAGIASLKGCPDKDGDGIADKDDKCPDVKGLGKYNGCPIPDKDKDGINDEEDQCPDQAGVVRFRGCPVPDADGDGVNDEEDKCPKEKGPSSNFGCPVIDQAVVEKVNKASGNIFFATGSSKLLASSNAYLNSIVTILNENPSYLADIDGYTDNTGSDERNIALSEARANAVKAYLVSKGIEERKLVSTGHGSENPIADNATKAGRSKNRRVEIKMRNY